MIDNNFKFFEADDPQVEDDYYELVKDDRFYIQVVDLMQGNKCQYIVRKDNGCFLSEAEVHGTYNNLRDAKIVCLNLSRGGE